MPRPLRHFRRIRSPLIVTAALLSLGTALTAQAATPTTPVPQDPGASTVRPFLGSARGARPISGVRFAPRHPYMAVNDRSNLHDDAYQSDAGWVPGPLGRRPQVDSALFTQECASVTFDRRGRILTVCVGVRNIDLRMIDPVTLDVLADYPLPPRPASTSGTFTSFGGGGYFYVDQHDRVVVPTSDGHIAVIAETGTAASPALTLRRRYDVSRQVGSSPIMSALPDWRGRIWFVSKSGVVGVVRPRSGAVRALKLPHREQVGNSFAVDETGAVFVVSDGALYRLHATRRAAPYVDWRRPYDAGTRIKPGQTEHGSGTTPTVIKRGHRRFVAITDNADPRMHVLVFEAGRRGPGGRPICRIPVFPKGRSATDNSLIAFGRSIVVENNYGYTGPVAPSSSYPQRQTPTTVPGVTRIVVSYSRRRCHVAWANNRVRVPTSVSKVSAATGLVYVYEHPAAREVQYRTSEPPTGPEDPWYLSALDARSGRRVWSVLTGVGLGYNNNYAPITLGPDGTAYIGTLGGLISVRAR